MNAITIPAGQTPSRATLIKSLFADVSAALDHSSSPTAIEALRRAEQAIAALFRPSKPTKAKRIILPLVRDLRRNAAERDAIDKTLLDPFSPAAREYARLMDREAALLSAVMLSIPTTLAEAAHQVDAALDRIFSTMDDAGMPMRLEDDLTPARVALEAVRDLLLRHAGLSPMDLWSRVNTEPEAETMNVTGGAPPGG